MPRRLVAALVAAAACSAALAQDAFPSRPLRIIVPFAAGGSVDISARMVAQPMSDELGQPVVVENRAGAGGRLGGTAVAKAVADGYTLLAGSSGSLTGMEAVTRNPPYSVLKDFTAIALVNVTPMAVVAGPGGKAATLAEFLAAAKAAPGTVGVASAGTGTSNHLAIELLQTVAGVQFLHVPYKGSGQALQDLLAGQVPYMVDQIASSAGHAKQGKLRVLSVMTSQRSSILPEVQTLAELGLPGVEAASFTGILAPAGLPAPIVERLQKAVLAAAAKPQVMQRFREIGADPRALGASAFSEFLKADLERWKGVATKANLILD